MAIPAVLPEGGAAIKRIGEPVRAGPVLAPTCNEPAGLVVPMPTLAVVLSTTNVFPATDKFPEMLTFPATCNVYVGFVVPMPTLPDDVTNNDGVEPCPAGVTFKVPCTVNVCAGLVVLIPTFPTPLVAR
jgi:hypothetical protein